MMPTFPSSSLKFRSAGFPRYGFKAGISDKAFPFGVSRTPVGLPLSFVLPASLVGIPVLCRGTLCAGTPPFERPLPLYPKGPSLRSGLCCPGPSTLNRPHPSHSRAHPDFTAWRLIRDVFAVHIRICLSDPRLVLSFHRCSFTTCRPLRPRGTLRLSLPSTSPKTLAFNSV